MAASEYTSVKASVEDLLVNGVGAFLADATHGSGVHASSVLLGHQLTKAFNSYYILKKSLEDETFKTAITALTKSGKSTLINAFAGATLLPSNNIPESARIVSIEHTGLPEARPVLSYKLGEQSITVEGESEIYSHLEYLNKEVRSRQHRKDDEQVLAIQADIAALPKGDAEQQCRLHLLDTPGTNEANEDRLRHSVERLLDSVDAVVYILDYTKLKTSEEADLLAKLKEANPQLVRRLAERLFFVVNKIDSMHSNAGLQEEELCEYVADLITKQMNCPEFQLKPEQVMLVSAQEALLARLVLLDRATEEDRRKFCVKAWGSSWARRKQVKSEAEMQEQAAQMLEDSRLPEMENRLFSFLYKNAGGLKLVSLLDNMGRLLNEIAEEGEELQRSLEATLARFDTVQKDADQIEHDVTDNVQARMQTLKEKLFAHVNEVLEGVEDPTLPAVRSGPWRKAWEKAVHFLRRSNRETQNDWELREKLHELHQDIQNQVSNEIHQFWHDLEVATNDKHQQLIGILNVHLDSLARDVEQVVGAALNLRLEPLDIQLDPPNAQQFHKSIQDLFETGIGRNTRTEKESREEDYTVWETRYRGLCRTTEYYVGIPAKRRVDFDKEVTTFQLNTENIKEYFQNMVNSSVDTSIKHVRAYVHAYLSDNIRAARSKISGYGEMYSDIMQRALEIKSRSFEEQDAGMKSLEAQVQAVTKLLADVSALQEQASHLLAEADPHNGWQFEPSQLEVEEASEGLHERPKPELLKEQSDQFVQWPQYKIDRSWAEILKAAERTLILNGNQGSDQEGRGIASSSRPQEDGLEKDVDNNNMPGVHDGRQTDEHQKFLKKILGIYRGSSLTESEKDTALDHPVVALNSRADSCSPILTQKPNAEEGKDKNCSMTDPNPFAQQQEEVGESAQTNEDSSVPPAEDADYIDPKILMSLIRHGKPGEKRAVPSVNQSGQGSLVPPAEAASHSDPKTWMDLVYSGETGETQAVLPLSKSMGPGEGTSSGSVMSSPKSKHSSGLIATIPTDVELPQEAGNTPVKLPRQDSLDSSEWECLSHEQFLPEAQA